MAKVTDWSLLRPARWVVGVSAALALLSAASLAQASYFTTVSNDPSLVGYWRLGESAGPTAVDVEGANNGTYNNFAGGAFSQAGALPGDTNTAVNFNGSNTYVNLGSAASLNGSWTGLTFMAWIKPANVSGVKMIIGSWNGTPPGDHMGLFQVDDRIVFAIADGINAESGSSSDATHVLTANQYNFVAATWVWDGVIGHHGTYTFYVNGQATGTGTQGGTNGINTGSSVPLQIGAQNSSGRFYNGTIDEPALFSRALSASEIADLYLEGLEVPEPSSLAALLLAGGLMLRHHRI